MNTTILSTKKESKRIKKIIPYGRQKIFKDDLLEIKKALNSEYITSGRYVEKFEASFCNYTKAKYSVSCSSGTAAIHLALEAINLKENDNIIIPSINFIAAANMAKKLGAKIFLADVDPISGQMTPNNLLDCIKINKIKKLKAFFSMYNGGNPNYVKDFYKIKKKYNSFFIEDACHALGAKYSIKENLKVGDCKYADISTFSFHPLKSITTGEGGMVSTSRKDVYEKCKILRNHGIIRKQSTKKKYNWFYKVKFHGMNYRLSDINCALGFSQIKKIDTIIFKREKIAKLYNKLFSNNLDKIKIQKTLPNQRSAWHLYIILINFKKLKINRSNLIKKLYQRNIITQVHYIPTFRQTIFSKLKKKMHKNTINYYMNCLSLPIYYDLKAKEQKYIANTINYLVKKYSK